MKLRFPKYEHKFKMWRCSKLSKHQLYPHCTWARTLGPPAKHAGMHPGHSDSNSEFWGRLLKGNLPRDGAVALQQDTNFLLKVYTAG